MSHLEISWRKSWVLTTIISIGALMAGTAHASFLPKNSMRMPLGRATNITQAEFNGAVENVASFYADIVATHGAKLVMDKDWLNDEVNSSADQHEDIWAVHSYGGLARHPLMTVDGLKAITCHELGHHLGGFSFYPNMNTWASNEGEADYFATQVCLKKVWASEKAANAAAQATVAPEAKQACDRAYAKVPGRQLCYRIGNASFVLGSLLAEFDTSKISFSTPDPTVVPDTINYHPVAQCRLDTYMSGAVCTAGFTENKIPGRNHPAGQDSLDAEKEAAETSCSKVTGYSVGLRPACWFHSRM